MMTPMLTRRQELLMLLLEQPDAPDLPSRAHRWIYRSPADRDALKQDLLVRWMVRREIEGRTMGRLRDYPTAREAELLSEGVTVGPYCVHRNRLTQQQNFTSARWLVSEGDDELDAFSTYSEALDFAEEKERSAADGR